jgi:translation elongation factor EF-Tu-like GTPase
MTLAASVVQASPITPRRSDRTRIRRSPLSRLTVRSTTHCTRPDPLPSGVEIVMPGDYARVEVRLDRPIALVAGSRFAVREGGKTVGSGVVAEVLE